MTEDINNNIKYTTETNERSNLINSGYHDPKLHVQDSRHEHSQ